MQPEANTMTESQSQADLSVLLQQITTLKPATEAFDESVKQLVELARDEPGAKGLLAALIQDYPQLSEYGVAATDLYHDLADMHGVERLAVIYAGSQSQQQAHAARAFELVQSLSASAYPHHLTQLALMYTYGVGCDPDQSKASSYLLQAAAQGYTLAFVLLAERYSLGSGVVQSWLIAIAWQKLAVLRKFPGANTRLIGMQSLVDQQELEQAGNLSERIKKNLMSLPQALSRIGLNEIDPGYTDVFLKTVGEHFNQIGESGLSALADSNSKQDLYQLNKQAKMLSWMPRVMLAKGLLSTEECLYALDACSQFDQSSDSTEQNQYSIELQPSKQPLISSLLRLKLSAQVHLPLTHFEPDRFEYYPAGLQTEFQADFVSQQTQCQLAEMRNFSGQRLLTAFCLLNNREGKTKFKYPSCGLEIELEAGDVLIHFNTTADGVIDPGCHYAIQTDESNAAYLLRTGVKQCASQQSAYRLV